MTMGRPSPMAWVLHLALGVCALLSLGCAHCGAPAIDPTGQSLFITRPPRAHPQPGKVRHHHDACVVLVPTRVVAPVGTEVVLRAGVCGKAGHLLAGEQVEWHLAAGSVGQFIEVGQRNLLDMLTLGTDVAHKVDASYAIGRTSWRYYSLTRGTSTPDDDVIVLRGQSWVTVHSPIEGSSHVTVFAPDVYGWDGRQQSATVHWVDAEWVFPPPAVNPAGQSHIFTTTVTRHTNHSPVTGWVVRYQIVGGPPASLAPDGSQVVEIQTNELGQASVEIAPVGTEGGTSRIEIQIIRPPLPGETTGPLVVGNGTTTKTWTGPQLGLRKNGPAQATVGSTLAYRIELFNPGQSSVDQVVVSEPLVAGLSFVGSQPPGDVLSDQVQWRVGTLAPGQSRTIEVQFRADQPGSISNCATASAAGGLSAQDCATTTVLATAPPQATVGARMTGPAQAVVGDQVTFEIAVTNQGDAPLRGLLIRDDFDPGLVHEISGSPIDRDLGDLAPGQTQQIGVTFRVTQPGRLCNRVQVFVGSRVVATAQACVTALAPEAPPAAPPAAPPPSGQPAPPPTQPSAPRPQLSVTKTGPRVQSVGQTAEFTITLENNGTVEATDLKVVDTFARSLDPVMATDGSAFVGDDLVWRIDRLPPGQRVVLLIHCTCLRPDPRACNRVIVTSAEEVRVESEACLEIRQQSAEGLTLTTGPLEGPLAVGQETTFRVFVRNNGRHTIHHVQLAATAPDALNLVSRGTRGPAEYDIVGPRVLFVPIEQLPPGQTLTYEIRAMAARTGEARLAIEVQASGLEQSIETEQPATIFAAN